MPYITQRQRDLLYNPSADNVSSSPNGPGELNYVLTTVILEYVKSHPGYAGVNDVLGALEGAKLEFYRRYAAPYEDKKIAENGDVY